MKIYIYTLCALSFIALQATSIKEEGAALQRDLVSVHTLVFGGNSLINEPLNQGHLTAWNQLLLQKILTFITAHGTPEQQSELGQCLAANIDLQNLIRQAPSHSNVQQAIVHAQQAITNLNNLETKQTKRGKTTQPVQLLLNHLTIALNVTLQRALKEVKV